MAHKLLLADPSPAIRRVVEITFADTGVDVISVADGEEAIARIPVDRPDIVLADISMAKRSGYDVSAFVKSESTLSAIPVLLLAGAFELVDDDLVQASECNGVLVKPFEPQHVIARVHELLGGAIGSQTRATGDILRLTAALTAPRPVEFHHRDTPEEIPGDLVDLGHAGFDDTPSKVAPPAEVGRGVSPAVDPLDDYFDKLNEAVASVGDRARSFAVVPPRPEAEPLPVQAVASEDVTPSDESDDLEDGEVPTLEELLAGDLMEGDDVAQPQQEPESVPTIEALLAHATVEEPVVPVNSAPPVSEPKVEPESSEPAPVARQNESDSRRAIIGDFGTLLAGEHQQPVSPAEVPVVTDDVVDQLAKRVTDRLTAAGQQTIEAVVTRVVGAAADRAVQAAVDRSSAAIAERLSAEVWAAVEAAVVRLVAESGQALLQAEIERRVPSLLTQVSTEVTRKLEDGVSPVLGRVSDEVSQAAEAAVARLVAGVVSEVSERMVREEIARIRGQV
jgi:CheY-like chemotaxis protein